MSTKIYDAYKLEKNYSLQELDQLFQEIRKKIQQDSEVRFQQMVISDFLFYFNTKRLNGDTWVCDKIEKNKKDMQQKSIQENVKNERWSVLWFEIGCELVRKITKPSNYGECLLSHDFKSDIQIFPMENRILLMYFGSSEGQKVIETLMPVKDYHYQNQTDRPFGISEKEWNRRCTDWDNVIGPDYIPANHGFSVKLCNPNLFSSEIVSSQTDANNTLSEEHILYRLRNSMPEMDALFAENNINTSSYSSVTDFMKTDVYAKWEKEANDIIREKCFIPINRKEIMDIISGKRQ